MLARFEREAQILAALNHPNIAQIYGFEKQHGVGTLVMELVPGLTLADRLALDAGRRRGPHTGPVSARSCPRLFGYGETSPQLASSHTASRGGPARAKRGEDFVGPDSRARAQRHRQSGSMILKCATDR